MRLCVTYLLRHRFYIAIIPHHASLVYPLCWGVMPELHRKSAYMERRAALASRSDTCGPSDPGTTGRCPVLTQSYWMRSVRIAI